MQDYEDGEDGEAPADMTKGDSGLWEGVAKYHGAPSERDQTVVLHGPSKNQQLHRVKNILVHVVAKQLGHDSGHGKESQAIQMVAISCLGPQTSVRIFQHSRRPII